MRTNYLKSGILYLGCLVFIFSCQKQALDPPKIKFLANDHNQNLDNTDNVLVNIDVWDEQEVVSYEITLSSISGIKYFMDQKDINKAFHHISYEFDLSSTTHQQFDITIAVKDNEGNRSSDSIRVMKDN